MNDDSMGKEPVSPYLRRPLRSLEDVLRRRLLQLARRRGLAEAARTDNGNNLPALPPSKPA